MKNEHEGRTSSSAETAGGRNAEARPLKRGRKPKSAASAKTDPTLEALRQSDARYKAFIRNSSEGIWRFELDEPIPTDLPAEEQVRLAFERGYLAECNDAMARQYGLTSADELIGSRLSELLIESDPRNHEYLKAFVESGYKLSDAESHEKDINGADRYFMNNLVGEVEEGCLVRAWGTQRDVTGTRHALEATERLAAIVTSSDDAIISKDLNAIITSWNRGAERIFGYTAEEAIGRSITMLIPEDRLYEEDVILARIRSGQKVDHYETIRRRKDGTLIDVSLTISPLKDAAGRVVGASKIARDISDRKAAEAIADRYRELSTRARDIILFLDQKTGRVVEANKTALETYGYSREEILTKTIHDLRAPETHSEIERQYVTANERGIQFETLHIRKDGTRFPVEVSAVGSTVAGERLVVSIVRDITERRLQEEALEQNQLMLALAMRSSRMGVWERDIASGAVWWSEELEEIFGLEKGGFRGTEEHFYELIYPDDREATWAEVESAIAERRPYTTEFRFVRADGQLRWMEGRGEAVYSQDGRPVRLYGVGIDITDRKEAEKALRESDSRFRLALSSGTVTVYEQDENLRYKWVFPSEPYSPDVIGKTDAELSPGPDADRRMEIKRRVLETGEGVGEVMAATVQGEERWYDVLVEPRFDAEGRITGVGGTALDITDRKRAETRLALLARISELIRTHQDPADLLYAVSEAVGEHLRVKRCLFNEIDLENDLEIVHRDYCRGAASVAGTHRISDYSTVTSAEMAAGKTVVNTDSMSDPRTCDLYEKTYGPNGERSYVAVPLLRGGRWVASLWVSDDEPRTWSEQEVALLMTAAERTWTAVEKLRTETVLRESEERLRAMFAQAGVGVVLIGPDCTIYEVNPKFCEITGYAEDELLGRSCLDITHPDDRNENVRAIEALLSGDEQTASLEKRYIRKDHSTVWARINIAKIAEPAGKGRLVAIVEDVSDRNQAEESLRRRTEFDEAVMASMGEGLYTVDAQGRVTSMNPVAEKLFGLSFEEIQGQPMHEITHYKYPDGSPFPAEECTCIQVLITGQAVVNHEDFFIRSDGSFFDVVYSSSPIWEDGKISGLVVIFRDVTEQKRAQEALIRAERRAADDYQKLLERIVPLGQTLGTARDLPAIYRSILGFIRGSMPCSAFFISFYDAESSLRHAAYAWGEQGEVDISLLPPLKLTPDGGPNSQAVFERRPVIVDRYMEFMKDRPHIVIQNNGSDPNSSIAVPMVVMDRVIGTIEVQAYEHGAFKKEHVVALEMAANLAAVAIENVRLLEIEAKARSEAEAANRMKDEFLSILSHELRTPLNAMLGWVRMLRAGILDEERSAKGLEVIERNTRQQSSLIEDLLDVSRIISGKMRIEKELVDFAAIVKEVAESMRPLAANKLIEFEFRDADEPVFVDGDNVRLRQVVTNLVQNAIKFTPANGRVEVSLANENGNVSVAVRDTGVGIEPDFLPFIFDRFSQADASTKRSFTGLGLGLTIVRNIVELHGGRVKAVSEGKDRGATFTVTLPLSEGFYSTQDTAEIDDIGPRDDASLKDVKVLLIDDDAESILPLQIFLEREKANVTFVQTAAEALEQLASVDFDVLISDIGMPATDGYELMRKLRTGRGKNVDTFAIAVTAYASAEDRERALAAGYQTHLSKPVNFDDLLAAIKQSQGREHAGSQSS